MAKHSKNRKVGKDESKPTVDKSVKVPQRDKIAYELNIRHRDDLTENQKRFLALAADKETKVIFLSGPAGTSKTYISILAGLLLLDKHSVSDILYIRTVIESASRSLGYLPGEFEMKLQPYLQPLMDKLDELLPADQAALLIKEKRAEGVPVNFLRGASFNAKFIIADEMQNGTIGEITTILTRLGRYSKIVVCGDPGQSDIGNKSGFQKMYDLFNDEESKRNGVHCFAFTKADIVRSEIVKYIVGRLEGAAPAPEPMFPAKTQP